jgi:hypothetical protein
LCGFGRVLYRTANVNVCCNRVPSKLQVNVALLQLVALRARAVCWLVGWLVGWLAAAVLYFELCEWPPAVAPPDCVYFVIRHSLFQDMKQQLKKYERKAEERYKSVEKQLRWMKKQLRKQVSALVVGCALVSASSFFLLSPFLLENSARER